MNLGPTETRRESFGVAVRACVVLCASTAFAVIPVQALAHTGLESTVPVAGTTVQRAPDAVHLVFTEQVQSARAVILVRSPSGENLATGASRGVSPGVSQRISELPTPGRYTVAYRVVSADGHPVTGSYTFRFDPPRAEASVVEPADVPSPDQSPAAAEPSDANAKTGTVQLPAEVDEGAPLVGLVLGSTAVAVIIALGGFLSRRRRLGGDRHPS